MNGLSFRVGADGHAHVVRGTLAYGRCGADAAAGPTVTAHARPCQACLALAAADLVDNTDDAGAQIDAILAGLVEP